MTKMIAKLLASTTVIAAAAATPASATTTVGGYKFADDAFADAVVITGDATFSSGTTPVSALIDKDVNTYTGVNGTLSFAFNDNVVFNGTGNDLVLFELGNILDGWNVTINSITRTYTSSFTGQQGSQFQINAAAIDLSDFGLANGATLSRLLLAPGSGTSTSLVGALNSQSVTAAVPEPATWGMMVLGFGAMGFAMRRRHKVAVSYAA